MTFPKYRHSIEVDGTAMCSGPWDEGDGAYIQQQMQNYKDISPDSVVRGIISFQFESFDEVVRAFAYNHLPDEDCTVSVAQFREYCAAGEFKTCTAKLIAAPKAHDPLQGDHYVTLVDMGEDDRGNEQVRAIDWTARQFATILDAPDEPIAEPLIWEPDPDAASSYPLGWVDFTLGEVSEWE